MSGLGAADLHIGGAVSGLADGESVVLADNGTDSLTVIGNTVSQYAIDASGILSPERRQLQWVL